MADTPKLRQSTKGALMHFTVGAVIERDGKYLLLDRGMEPLGFAGLAGHINEGEEPEEALLHKILDESGLKVKAHYLLFEEEVEWNRCRVGISSHYWYLYRCTVKGKVRNNPEASKSIGWYTPEEMKKLKWEPVWRYWFEKLGVLAK